MANADAPLTSTPTSNQPQSVAPASTDVLNGQTQSSSPPTGSLSMNTGNQIQSGSVIVPLTSSSPLQAEGKNSATPAEKKLSDYEKVPPPSYYPPNEKSSPLNAAAPQLPGKMSENVSPLSYHPSSHKISPPENAERPKSDTPERKEKLPPPGYFPQNDSPQTQSPQRKSLFKSLYDGLLGKMDGRTALQIRKTIERLVGESRHLHQELKNSKLRMKGSFPYYNPFHKKSLFEKLFDKILSKLDARTANKIRGMVDRLTPRKKGFFEKLFNRILKRMDARTAQQTRDVFKRMGQEGRHLLKEIKSSTHRIKA